MASIMPYGRLQRGPWGFPAAAVIGGHGEPAATVPCCKVPQRENGSRSGEDASTSRKTRGQWNNCLRGGPTGADWVRLSVLVGSLKQLLDCLSLYLLDGRYDSTTRQLL